MKILLAPAETKNAGGEEKYFCKDNFSFPSLFEKRETVFNAYEKFIDSLNIEDSKIWFGIKNENEIKKYKESLKNKPSMKAIQRYNGVAFDALDYVTLNENEKKYIDKKVVIFSNLFGPLYASDNIPDYKYKQGSKLPDINVEKYYNDNFTQMLDDELGNEIIDIRAGFYEKFYKIKKANVLTFKFIKDGKVVSHWAKYYRGKLLRALAQNNVNTISEFMHIHIDGLNLVEIQEKKNIKLLVMEIK